ncbi:MAG: HAD family hydrolase [Erysipelotrichaceae bacterium]|nr:HAD family hydrolase [Erysipelotrichaceae bacterium]
MNVKHVFCDVDETLLENLQPVPKTNIRALKKLREASKRFTLTSGRNPGVIYDVMKECAIPHTDDEYVICCGGALIITATGKTVFEDPLSKDDFISLITYLKDTSYDMPSFVDREYYHILRTRVEPLFNQWSHDALSYDEALQYIETHRPYKFIIRGEAEDLKRMAAHCEMITGGNIVNELSHAEIIDLMNRTVSKGNAMRKVCEMTGTHLSQTLAIGDNDNDLSLLEAAAFKACPANAVDSVKRIADYISPFSCGKGAVADIIERFVLR